MGCRKKVPLNPAHLIWFAVIALGTVCRAESQYQIETLPLSGIPCLINLNNTEYEWGVLDAGKCQGVRRQSGFFSIAQYRIRNQILWSGHRTNTRHSAAECIRYRGHFNKLPESGLSGCLCSVMGQNGLYTIGEEQQASNGMRSCMTREQSYSGYFIARQLSPGIVPEPEPGFTSTLGYIFCAGFGGLSILATCDIWCNIKPVNKVMALFYALTIAWMEGSFEVFTREVPGS